MSTIKYLSRYEKLKKKKKEMKRKLEKQIEFQKASIDIFVTIINLFTIENLGENITNEQEIH